MSRIETMEFTQDVTRPVIVSIADDVIEGPGGGLKIKQRVYSIDWERGEQINAQILERTQYYYDLEIVDHNKGNLGLGLMLRVPREVLEIETEAPNLEWEDE